jgi:hypothetical protein
VNDRGESAYLCRLKGVKSDVIGLKANELYPDNPVIYTNEGLFIAKSDESDGSIWKLYEDLYNGKEISFDLCSGESPCLNMNSDFSISTKDSFIRKISCK